MLNPHSCKVNTPLLFPTFLLYILYQKHSVKKMFLQNSQENTCTRVSFLIKFRPQPATLFKKRESGTGVFCEFCEIFKRTSFYRTPPVAVSDTSPISRSISVSIGWMSDNSEQVSWSVRDE